MTDGMMDGGMMSGGMMGGVVIWFILLLLLMAAATVALIMLSVRLARKDTAKDANSSSAAEEALSVLRTRFARGEIDDEEYRSRLHALDQQ